MNTSAATRPLVLVVERESYGSGSLVSTLARLGFRTLHAGTGAGALSRAAGHQPDVVVVDHGEPDDDGIVVLARLRNSTSAPAIVLLEQRPHDDGTSVLEAGADDFLVRPFSAADLLSRIRVWLHRGDRARAPHPVSDPRSDRVHIDRDRRSLFVEGREVHVTPLECKLLLMLARSPGRSMTEDQMLAGLWGPGASARVQHLRAHVRQLRQKLERDPTRPRRLVNVAGGGYRLHLG